MPEPAAPPRLVKFVRRALRADPRPTFDDVLGRWRAAQRGEADPAQVQAVYDEELARAQEPRSRDPRHGQIVGLTIAIWILVQVGLALALGLPDYLSCRQAGQPAHPTGCGVNLGIVFVVVGFGQLLYSAIIALIAYRLRPPVAQGILIAMSIVVVLFTVVCFGAAASA